MVASPTFTLTNDGSGTSVTLTITSVIGATNTVYYMEDGSSVWLTGLNRTGSGTLQQTGLLPNKYYIFIVVSVSGAETSLPSNPQKVFTSKTGGGYAAGTAKILKPALLKKIVKRSIKASKEFQIVNGFILMEDRTVATNASDINPFANEDQEPDNATPLAGPYELVFSAELDIVTEFEIQNMPAGITQVGDIMLTINVEELEAKSLNKARVDAAKGIKVMEPQAVNKLGQVLNVSSGIYAIKGCVYQLLQNRMTDLEIYLSRQQVQ